MSIKHNYVSTMISRLRGMTVENSSIDTTEGGNSWSATFVLKDDRVSVNYDTNTKLIRIVTESEPIAIHSPIFQKVAQEANGRDLHAEGEIFMEIVDAWDLLSQIERSCETKTLVITEQCEDSTVVSIAVPFDQEVKGIIQKDLGSDLISILNEDIDLFRKYKEAAAA